MKRFWAMIRREPGLKIASLAVALVLVSWRANVANPLEKRTYQNQAIKPTGLAEDLLLVTPPRQATVVVRGPRRTLDILSRDSRVEPTVDLSTLRQPTWSTVPIEVELPAGVELLEVNPKDLLVEIDVLERQTKPIVVDLASGAPAPGYVAEDVALSLNRAEISGPRRAVSRVARLTAAVDVIGARDTISGEARLLAVDATGLRVTGVDTNPLTVRYTVRVIAAQGSRELEAVAKLTGEPAAGVQVAAVSTQPTTIRLTGPQPALLALEDRVPTEPLDVTGWKESSAKVVPLALPEGVRAEPDEVTVTVTLTDRDPAR